MNGLLGTLGSVLALGSSFLPLILILLAAAALFWLARVVRWVGEPLLFAVKLIPAGLLAGIGVLSLVLWRPARRFSRWAWERFELERRADAYLASAAGRGAGHLLAGRRLEVAQSIWPPEQYPDLYRAVPKDIERPLFEDGRLLGGVRLTWLADRHLTARAYRSAMQGGLTAGIVVALVLLVFPTLVLINGLISDSHFLFAGGVPTVLERWPGEEPIQSSSFDGWTARLVPSLGLVARQLLVAAAQWLGAALMGVGAALLFALLLLAGWQQSTSEPYRFVTKDAEIRWPYRLEWRRIVREAYRRQVLLATERLRGAPTFLLGRATGTLRVRGDVAGPVPAQEVRLDAESLFQHLLVFGGTGEGKTTALLKPLLRQVLADRRYGAFVSDAKGVLWQDVRRVAGQLGRAKDVVLVGSGPGQVGVDVMSHLTPTQVAGVLRSILSQVSGGGSNSGFWADMAANIMRHMLTLGRGYAKTPRGQRSIKAGLHPYSLWWAYQAVIVPKVMEEAVSAIEALRNDFRARQDELERDRDTAGILVLAAELDATLPQDLKDTVEYLLSAWRGMAAETKTGVIAQVTQVMDGFAGAVELRERFVSGRPGAGAIGDALAGKLVLNTLSTIEDGLPARLVSILLKTNLYGEARRREAAWKRASPPRDPQDAPCLVVMDEVQELATVDPTSGLSDASFWNVARSTGLAGIFATQTIAALEQAMGKAAAANFVQQTRSRVFFRTEERETVQYACWCAGEFERNRVFDEGQRESIEARGLIDAWDPFAPVDELAAVPSSPRTLFATAAALLRPAAARLAIATATPPYPPELEGVDRSVSRESERGLTKTSAERAERWRMEDRNRAAIWRSEDQERTYRSTGNDQRPALTPVDITHMGRWHAFAQVQRAGAVRQDVILVEHDFS